MFPLLWGVEEAPPASGVPEPPSPAGWLTDASVPGTEAGSPELALVLILVPVSYTHLTLPTTPYV